MTTISLYEDHGGRLALIDDASAAGWLHTMHPEAGSFAGDATMAAAGLAPTTRTHGAEYATYRVTLDRLLADDHAGWMQVATWTDGSVAPVLVDPHARWLVASPRGREAAAALPSRAGRPIIPENGRTMLYIQRMSPNSESRTEERREVGEAPMAVCSSSEHTDERLDQQLSPIDAHCLLGIAHNAIHGALIDAQNSVLRRHAFGELPEGSLHTGGRLDQLNRVHTWVHAANDFVLGDLADKAARAINLLFTTQERPRE